MDFGITWNGIENVDKRKKSNDEKKGQTCQKMSSFDPFFFDQNALFFSNVVFGVLFEIRCEMTKKEQNKKYHRSFFDSV